MCTTIAALNFQTVHMYASLHMYEAAHGVQRWYHSPKMELLEATTDKGADTERGCCGRMRSAAEPPASPHGRLFRGWCGMDPRLACLGSTVPTLFQHISQLSQFSVSELSLIFAVHSMIQPVRAMSKRILGTLGFGRKRLANNTE